MSYTVRVYPLGDRARRRRPAGGGCSGARRSRAPLSVAWIVASLWLAACGGDDRAPPPSVMTPDGGSVVPELPDDERVPPEADLDWQPCALYSGQSDRGAECARLASPYHHAEPEGTTIDVFVKRVRDASRPRGQLWLLNGGPGGAGADFEPLVDHLIDLSGGLEVYLVDHRGTGRSSRLSCAAEADLYAGDASAVEAANLCIEELGTRFAAGLGGFTVTEAAQDLGELIERTRHGDEPVFIYSVSYGTYWAQRYLQLFPEQANGVVLDSICAPGECQFVLRYDQLFDDVGAELLDACAASPTCGARLGEDPAERLDELLVALDGGHCPDLELDRTGMRRVLAQLLTIVGLRELIPSVIYRVERCEPRDLRALRALAAMAFTSSEAPDLSSEVLGIEILVSEFMERPIPPLADVAVHVAGLRISPDVGPSIRPLVDVWPAYAQDDLYGQFAQTDVPMLMLSGTLDPQTPPAVARPVEAHFNGAFQSFVEVPRAAHTVLTQSPIGSVLSEETCGAELMGQFLADPREPLDESCVERVADLDFEGEPLLNELLMGTADAWDGTPGASGSALRRFPQILSRRRALARAPLAARTRPRPR